MSGYIKFDKDMVDDPRVIEVATALLDGYVLAHRTGGTGCNDLTHPEALLLMRYVVTGALVTLWRYADEHINDADTLPISLDALDAHIGLEGFIGALPSEWIIKNDNGQVVLPGYCEKNGLITKRKRSAQAKLRMRKMRLRNDTSNVIHNTSVTDGSVTHVLRAVDRDRDRDRDSQEQDKKKEKERKRKKKPALRIDDQSVPGLCMEAWKTWDKYKSASRHPIKIPSRLAAAKKLASFGSHQVQHATVNLAVERGWQGLFAHEEMSRANGATVVNHNAEFDTLRKHAREIGFRDPWIHETPSAYRTDMHQWEIKPERYREVFSKSMVKRIETQHEQNAAK